MRQLVEDLMLAQHGRTAMEPLTEDNYVRWDRAYIFDAMRDQRYGQAFCNHFGITDNLLFYERDADRARRRIRQHYIDAVSGPIPPTTA